jgi:hypothetical protein
MVENFMIRNKQIQVDGDLTCLYGVEIKALNQAVKRKLARFPAAFMFELTEEQVEALASQSVIPAKKRNVARFPEQFQIMQSENEQLVTDCDQFASLKYSTTLRYAFTFSKMEMRAIEMLVRVKV